MSKRIAVCGGTSLAHALAAVVAADRDNEVTVLTRQPSRWSRTVRAIYLDLAEVGGPLARVSSDPADVVSGAAVVFVCVPFPARRGVLQWIAPYLAPDCWIGGIPGFAGFDWEARSVFGPDARIFGLQRVPYVRKTISYGDTVWISGIRPRLFLAALPAAAAPDVAARIEALLGIPTTALSNYLAVSLSASNAIFHPARLLGAFGDLRPEDRLPRRAQFYEDWDDASSEAYFGLDADIQSIAAALSISPNEATPIGTHYGVHSVKDLTDRIRSIRALRDRPLPLIGAEGNYTLDMNSPYITEDACFALVVLRSLADVAGVATPWLDRAIRWAEQWTGRCFLAGGAVRGPDSELLPTPRLNGIDSVLHLVSFAS